VSLKQWWRRRAVVSAAELRLLKSQMDEAFNRGDPAGAESVARALLDAHVDASPTDDGYLTAWKSWASALLRLGEHAAAAREYTTMIDTVGPVIGYGHVTIMRLRINRAVQFNVLARYEEAESDCRAAMEIAVATQPDRHGEMMRLLAINNLGAALIGQGMAAEAESLVHTALDEADSITDFPDVFTVGLRSALAASLNAQQRYPEALEVLQVLPPLHPTQVAGINVVLGFAQLGAGRLAEAEASGRVAVAAAGRFFAPSYYMSLYADTLLGAVLVRQGDLEEARRVLEVNAAAWAEHFGATHPRTIDAQRELAKTYDASPCPWLPIPLSQPLTWSFSAGVRSA
jgi:tetratricopeptide (TPR) repeat protein